MEQEVYLFIKEKTSSLYFQPCTFKEVSDRFSLTRAKVSTIISRLIKKGLVLRYTKQNINIKTNRIHKYNGFVHVNN